MDAIKGLKPARVWELFRDINQIPRGSGKEEKIRRWLLDFARDRGLEAVTDGIGNVIIRVPATPGRENRPAVIIQGHMDMVWEKNQATKHNFETDPIRLVRDGDWITADGTTLGADNGIAMAMALAVADPRSGGGIEQGAPIEHGPLELFFTIDEETGLVGATNMEPALLSGRILLNLDSEEESTLYIGCAGGVNTEGWLPVSLEKAPASPGGNAGDAGDFAAFRLSVTGLRGGHSGSEIHKGLANALHTAARVLRALRKKTGARLWDLHGGGLHNVIPRECFADLLIPAGELQKARDLVDELAAGFIREWRDLEPEMKISLEPAGEKPEQVLTPESFGKVVDLIYSIPHGVIRMSRKMPELVETSTNLAAVKLESGRLYVLTSQRSSSNFLRDMAGEQIMACFLSAGGETSQNNEYPGWDPNPDSPLLKICAAAYRKIMGREPEIKAIHAGLECGVIGGKIPGIDMISLGPDIRNAHSPEERVSIPSLEKFWGLFGEILGAI